MAAVRMVHCRRTCLGRREAPASRAAMVIAGKGIVRHRRSTRPTGPHVKSAALRLWTRSIARTEGRTIATCSKSTLPPECLPAPLGARFFKTRTSTPCMRAGPSCMRVLEKSRQPELTTQPSSPNIGATGVGRLDLFAAPIFTSTGERAPQPAYILLALQRLEDVAGAA